MSKVAVVTSIHGEFDKRVWRHASSLSEKGIHVHLICPWVIPNDFASHKLKRIQFHCFKRIKARLLRPLISVKVFLKLLKIWRQVDLIHFHDLDLLPLMAIVSFFKPVIYDVHENYPEEMLTKYYLPIRLRNLFFKIVLIGEQTLAWKIRNIVLVVPHQLERFSGSRLRTVLARNYASRSLALKAENNYSSRANNLIYTGNLYKENGSLLLPQVLANISREVPDVRLILVDLFVNEAFQAEFTDLAKSLGVDKRIEIKKPVPSQEIWKICNEGVVGLSLPLDVVKARIALPTKLFEYMALKLPIVATDLPYARQVVEETQCGLLTSQDPRDIAFKIIQILQSREAGKRLGESGYDWFLTKYNWDCEVDRLILFYRKILCLNIS